MNYSIFVKCECECDGFSVVEFKVDDKLDCVNIAVWENRSTAKPLSKKKELDGVIT